MTGKTIRLHSTIAATLLLATAAGAAQPGQDVYKAKCQMCHGANGMAESGPGKAMHVKPASDPEVKNMSEARMIAAVAKGMGKMQAYNGELSEAQIRDSVAYFRSFLK